MIRLSSGSSRTAALNFVGALFRSNSQPRQAHSLPGHTRHVSLAVQDIPTDAKSTQRVDAATQRVDVAAQRVDAAAQRVDAAAQRVDAAAQRVDAAAQRVDAAAQRVDAAAQRVDAAAQRVDAAAQRVARSTRCIAAACRGTSKHLAKCLGEKGDPFHDLEMNREGTTRAQKDWGRRGGQAGVSLCVPCALWRPIFPGDPGWRSATAKRTDGAVEAAMGREGF
jgi:DNA repair ATPase RecN